MINEIGQDDRIMHPHHPDLNGQQGQKNSTNGLRDEKKVNAMSKKVYTMTKISVDKKVNVITKKCVSSLIKNLFDKFCLNRVENLLDN